LCFVFSSRRRHTRLVSDWSSDVCSSDLRLPILISTALPVVNRVSQGRRPGEASRERVILATHRRRADARSEPIALGHVGSFVARSEERRVGKECRAGGWPYG